MVHISLNPHPDDELSDEQVSEIAREYLEKMGYGEQPFVIVMMIFVWFWVLVWISLQSHLDASCPFRNNLQ